MSQSSSLPTPPNAPARRVLRFESLDDILADAERLAASSPVALGNWSPGQIFLHLARGMDLAIDGAPPAAWYVRFVGQTFLKRRFLAQTMPAGYTSPADGLVPGETGTAAGLNALRSAIGRTKATALRQPHPVFGALTAEEWISLHCRHAELHLSYLLPAEGHAGPAIAEP